MMESYRQTDIREKMTALYGEAYSAYRTIFEAPVPQTTPLPVHLDLDLRDACNLHCIMCHQNYRKRTHARSSEKIIRKAISEASGTLCAVNIGASAEPLLEKELFLTTMELCNEYEIMDTFTHTNGLLLDEMMADTLVDSGFKHVCISLDAATPKTYARVRGHEDQARAVSPLDAIEKNIRYLLKKRGSNAFPEIRLSFCVLPENQHEKERFLKKWQDRGADLIEFQQVRDVSIALEQSPTTPEKHCFAGRIRGMLWPWGDVTACCAGFPPEIRFGNITTASMAELWDSDAARQLRMQLDSGTDIPTFCTWCLNGCSA